MYHLSRPASREIIGELFSGPKTISQICSAISKGSPAVIRIIQELEQDNLVKSRKLERKVPGRKMKEYYLDHFRIPNLRNEDIRNILFGTETEAKTLSKDSFLFSLEDISHIKIRSRNGYYITFRPSWILNYLLFLGLSFREAFEVLMFDLADILYFGIPEEEIWMHLREMVENKFPDLSQSIETHIGSIEVDHGNAVSYFGIGELINIAGVELGIDAEKAAYLVSLVYDYVHFTASRKWSYIYLVLTLHNFALNRRISCKEPDILKMSIPEGFNLILLPLEESLRNRIIDYLFININRSNKLGIEDRNKFNSFIKKILSHFCEISSSMISLEQIHLPSRPLPTEILLKMDDMEAPKRVDLSILIDILSRYLDVSETDARFVAHQLLEKLENLKCRECNLILVLEIGKLILDEHNIRYREHFTSG